jgi:hypothetical protein
MSRAYYTNTRKARLARASDRQRKDMRQII